MCTIIVRHRMDYWCTTLVAANRDEFYARKATGPQVLQQEPRIVGGRDEEHGGTWFGLTASGLFVGLTNQRNWGARDDRLQSRGHVVIDALKTGSLQGVHGYVDGLDPSAFNEFNLMYGDGKEVWGAYSRHAESHVRRVDLGAGVHVLCNDEIGPTDSPKAAWIRKRATKFPRLPWPKLKKLFAELLSDHAAHDDDLPEPPANAAIGKEVLALLQSPCVHTPVYGTVSSTIAAIHRGRVCEYVASEGRPCEHEYHDFKHLLA